jgi:alkylation response protein AidB-like acyl-CoA dehydrogenase
VGRSKRELARLKRMARREQKNGRPLIADPLFGARVAELEIELMALETTVLRVLAQANKAPGAEASVLKVRGTEIQQRLTELMVEAAGPLALPFDPAYLDGETDHSSFDDDFAAPLLAHYFNYRKTSIYGGSNEIQRNIISQMILGL